MPGFCKLPHQKPRDFFTALGLQATEAVVPDEEPLIFAPTIGERVKRNVETANKMVSYKLNKTYKRSKKIDKLNLNKFKRKSFKRKRLANNIIIPISNDKLNKNVLLNFPFTNSKTIKSLATNAIFVDNLTCSVDCPFHEIQSQCGAERGVSDEIEAEKLHEDVLLSADLSQNYTIKKCKVVLETLPSDFIYNFSASPERSESPELPQTEYFCFDTLSVDNVSMVVVNSDNFAEMLPPERQLNSDCVNQSLQQFSTEALPDIETYTGALTETEQEPLNNLQVLHTNANDIPRQLLSLQNQSGQPEKEQNDVNLSRSKSPMSDVSNIDGFESPSLKRLQDVNEAASNLMLASEIGESSNLQEHVQNVLTPTIPEREAVNDTLTAVTNENDFDDSRISENSLLSEYDECLYDNSDSEEDFLGFLPGGSTTGQDHDDRVDVIEPPLVSDVTCTSSEELGLLHDFGEKQTSVCDTNIIEIKTEVPNSLFAEDLSEIAQSNNHDNIHFVNEIEKYDIEYDYNIDHSQSSLQICDVFSLPSENDSCRNSINSFSDDNFSTHSHPSSLKLNSRCSVTYKNVEIQTNQSYLSARNTVTSNNTACANSTAGLTAKCGNYPMPQDYYECENCKQRYLDMMSLVKHLLMRHSSAQTTEGTACEYPVICLEEESEESTKASRQLVESSIVPGGKSGEDMAKYLGHSHKRSQINDNILRKTNGKVSSDNSNISIKQWASHKRKPKNNLVSSSSFVMDKEGCTAPLLIDINNCNSGAPHSKRMKGSRSPISFSIDDNAGSAVPLRGSTKGTSSPLLRASHLSLARKRGKKRSISPPMFIDIDRTMTNVSNVDVRKSISHIKDTNFCSKSVLSKNINESSNVGVQHTTNKTVTASPAIKDTRVQPATDKSVTVLQEIEANREHPATDKILNVSQIIEDTRATLAINKIVNLPKAIEETRAQHVINKILTVSQIIDDDRAQHTTNKPVAVTQGIENTRAQPATNKIHAIEVSVAQPTINKSVNVYQRIEDTKTQPTTNQIVAVPQVIEDSDAQFALNKSATVLQANEDTRTQPTTNKTATVSQLNINSNYALQGISLHNISGTVSEICLDRSGYYNPDVISNQLYDAKEEIIAIGVDPNLSTSFHNSYQDPISSVESNFDNFNLTISSPNEGQRQLLDTSNIDNCKNSLESEKRLKTTRKLRPTKKINGTQKKCYEKSYNKKKTQRRGAPLSDKPYVSDSVTTPRNLRSVQTIVSECNKTSVKNSWQAATKLHPRSACDNSDSVCLTSVSSTEYQSPRSSSLLSNCIAPQIQTSEQVDVGCVFTQERKFDIHSRYFSDYPEKENLHSTSEHEGCLTNEEIEALIGRCKPHRVIAERHKIVSEGVLRYKCNECPAAMNTMPLLRQHYSQEHSRVYSCIFCLQCFQKPHGLRKHLQNHKDFVKFKCSFCKAIFSNASDLQSHQCNILEENDDPFKCDECKRTFRVKHLLVRHMRMHMDEKPFKCDTCNIAYKLVENYKRHVKLFHISKSKLECKICSMGFTQPLALSIHMAGHRGLKLFACSKCEKSFADPSTLEVHSLREH